MEKFIKKLAKDAGAILRDGFRTEFKINHKTAHWDVVTEFDLASEKFVIDKIQKKFPAHGILSEESGYVSRAKNFWIIDPLDGTHAFSRGLAQFSVSIAFISHGRIKHAVVFDPMTDELFYAREGKGAFLNGKKISVSAPPDLRFATLAMILASGKTTVTERKFFYNDLVVKYSLWNSKLESAALTAVYAACGRYDFVIMKHLSPWDYAAGALILSEAGAKVTDCAGKPWRWDFEDLVAAEPKLHKRLINIVSKFHEKI